MTRARQCSGSSGDVNVQRSSLRRAKYCQRDVSTDGETNEPQSASAGRGDVL
jgi:hypothetical protein